jgi:uncharacterized protein (DUF1800 family)
MGKDYLGSPPTLARLAYNRLGFGARPEQEDFGDDADAFTAYVDAQLDYEGINDSACDNYISQMARRDSKGRLLPSLDAPMREITQYVERVDKAKDDTYGPLELAIYLTRTTYARALFSQRQLYEVMVDFWTNHFNTIADDKGKYWEDAHVIRPHALGKFRDMLGASAKSPSMLRYLSNAYSDGDNPNENYGREVMELHTLGSINKIPGHPRNGLPNYTEGDVHAAAKIFSGWTLNFYDEKENPNGDDSFRFNESEDWPKHDYAKKVMQLDAQLPVTVIPEGGMEQGERLLDILAAHPSTAYFISWKLCKRLISDLPQLFCPDAVKAGMDAFLSSLGDIKTTVRAIVLHPKFAQSWGQKVKRPFEFYISVHRALGLSPEAKPWFKEYEWDLDALGQPLFWWAPPTGYPDVKQYWWSTNQLFGRWTMANRLVMRHLGEQWWYDELEQPTTALDQLIGHTNETPPRAQDAAERLMRTILGVWPDEADYNAVMNYLGDGDWDAPITSKHPRLRPLLGALLASPYFQWR